MRCHLNRMTAALLAALLLSIPAGAALAAPANERPAASQAEATPFVHHLGVVWQRLLAGLDAAFAGSSTDDESESTGTFDPDGYSFLPPDDGHRSTGTGSFDPDG